MAFFHCSYSSGALGKMTDFNLVLPNEASGASSDYKVLYLLHGLSDNNSCWERFSSVEQFAREMGIAVVMPDGGRSFYEDMRYGENYYTYIAKELPEYLQRTFSFSPEKQKNYIAGLSMGGYGALKIALRNPGRFQAAASMSGVVDIQFFLKNCLSESLVTGIFGEQPDFSQICLYSLLDKAIEKGEPLPRIFQCCGKQDFLYPVNLEFRDYLVKKVGNFVDLYRFEDSDGDHCWPYWNQQIQRIMKWMQEETTEK